MENKHEVLADLGVIGTKGEWNIHLTKTSWFGRKACFDIRPWEDGFASCGKGVTLTDDQAYELYRLLRKEFECE